MVAKRRIIVLTEGLFGLLSSKTANQVIRYIPEEVVGVIDSQSNRKHVEEVLGFGGTIPIFQSLSAALPKKPDTLLIGIAPTGGKLPETWRAIINEAIEHQLNIISGLHTYLSEDDEFSSRAKVKNVQLIDLRKVTPEYEVVAQGLWKNRKVKTILTVGTDCNVGKMTASLELHKEFLRRGLKSDFVATGQTGMLLSGKGVCIDSIVGDYIAGAIEMEVEKSIQIGNEFIHIEGQGSLTHQGYSSVTLGLMHGVMPDAMILVHHPIREKDDYGFRITDLKRLIELHEMILSPFKQSKVVGIAMNTVKMTQAQVAEAKINIEQQTGLPAADVLTPDVRILADAILKYVNDKMVQ